MKRARLIAWAELALMVRSRVALIGVIALLLLSTIAAATSYAHISANQILNHILALGYDCDFY